MGLISRVSSRTYRNLNDLIIASNCDVFKLKIITLKFNRIN